VCAPNLTVTDSPSQQEECLRVRAPVDWETFFSAPITLVLAEFNQFGPHRGEKFIYAICDPIIDLGAAVKKLLPDRLFLGKLFSGCAKNKN